MPAPWPSLKPPAASTVGPARPLFRSLLRHSRLALAASVAFLMVGLWLLSGQVDGKGHIRLIVPRNGDADRNHQKDLIKKANEATKDNVPKVGIEPKMSIEVRDNNEAFMKATMFPTSGSPMK